MWFATLTATALTSVNASLFRHLPPLYVVQRVAQWPYHQTNTPSPSSTSSPPRQPLRSLPVLSRRAPRQSRSTTPTRRRATSPLTSLRFPRATGAGRSSKCATCGRKRTLARLRASTQRNPSLRTAPSLSASRNEGCGMLRLSAMRPSLRRGTTPCNRANRLEIHVAPLAFLSGGRLTIKVYLQM